MKAVVWIRRVAGVAVAVFGGFTLLGGLAVPPHVLVSEPGIAPAPEPVAAVLLIMAGLDCLPSRTESRTVSFRPECRSWQLWIPRLGEKS